MLTVIRPLFFISGPTTCSGAFLSNITTLLNLTNPTVEIPIISDTLNVLPPSLAHHEFDVHRTLHHEKIFSEIALEVTQKVVEYKPDIIYCNIQETNPLIEYLIRKIEPRILISIGHALPSSLVTIQLPQEELELTTIFPFLQEHHSQSL